MYMLHYCLRPLFVHLSLLTDSPAWHDWHILLRSICPLSATTRPLHMLATRRRKLRRVRLSVHCRSLYMHEIEVRHGGCTINALVERYTKLTGRRRHNVRSQGGGIQVLLIYMYMHT